MASNILICTKAEYNYLEKQKVDLSGIDKIIFVKDGYIINKKRCDIIIVGVLNVPHYVV